MNQITFTRLWRLPIGPPPAIQRVKKVISEAYQPVDPSNAASVLQVVGTSLPLNSRDRGACGGPVPHFLLWLLRVAGQGWGWCLELWELVPMEREPAAKRWWSPQCDRRQCVLTAVLPMVCMSVGWVHICR